MEDRRGYTPESQTLISEIQARMDLLEQELERAHERDRETRRLLAAALERIPLQTEAPLSPSEGEPEGIRAPTVSPSDEQGSPETAAAQEEDGASDRLYAVIWFIRASIVVGLFILTLGSVAGGFIYSIISAINGDQMVTLVSAIIGLLGTIGAALIGIFVTRRGRSW